MARQQRRGRRRHPGLAPAVHAAFRQGRRHLAGPLRRRHVGRGAPPGPGTPRWTRRGSARAPTARTATRASRCATRSAARPSRPSSRALLRDAGIERVVVVGLATDYCVKATALDAARLGLRDARPDRRDRRRRPRAGRRRAGARRDATPPASGTVADGDAMIRGAIRLAIVGCRHLATRSTGSWRTRRKGAEPEPISSMVVIDAPIERVWDGLADIEDQPRWMTEMKAIRILDDGPVGVGTTLRGGRPDLRHHGHGPGHDHRVRAAPSLRDQPRRHVQGPRPDHPRAGRRRDDDDRPLGRDPRSRRSSPTSARWS